MQRLFHFQHVSFVVAMPKTLALVFQNPSIRISTASIFFFGFAGAATSPYLSIIGIQELGLSDRLYALVILLGALVSVSASVLIGTFADRVGSYRMALIATSLMGVVGFSWVYFLPSSSSFIIAKVVFIPFFTALNALVFANVRSETADLSSSAMSAVNSTVRATLSLSWVLVPGIVGIMLSASPTMLPAFLFAGACAFVCFLLFAFLLPEIDINTRRRRVEPFLDAFSAFAGAGIWFRMLAIALITAMLHMNGTVLPLILTEQAGGSVSDVGVIVGIVAGLEIIFIVFWSYVERYLSHVVTLVIGALIYTTYLYLLGQVTAPWQAFALTPLASLGAAAIISIPLTYLQNLISNRPGLASSLISINMFSSAGLAAGLFALGTNISNYAGTAVLGAIAGFMGSALVLYLDGPRRGRR